MTDKGPMPGIDDLDDGRLNQRQSAHEGEPSGRRDDVNPEQCGGLASEHRDTVTGTDQRAGRNTMVHNVKATITTTSGLSR